MAKSYFNARSRGIVFMKILLIALLALGLSNCAGNRMPSPKNSKTITCQGGGVTIDTHQKSKPFTIDVFLKTTNAAPNPAYITSTYESPANGIKLKPVFIDGISSGKAFSVVSEPFAKVRNHTNHIVHIKLYADKQRTILVDSVDEQVRMSLTPDLARAMGVEKQLE